MVDIGCPAIGIVRVSRVGARRFLDVASVAADFLQDFQLIISFFGISTSLIDGIISPLSASSTSLLGLSSPTIVSIGKIGVFAVRCW